MGRSDSSLCGGGALNYGQGVTEKPLCHFMHDLRQLTEDSALGQQPSHGTQKE